jgi:hypothetical protein
MLLRNRFGLWLGCLRFFLDHIEINFDDFAVIVGCAYAVEARQRRKELEARLRDAKRKDEVE